MDIFSLNENFELHELHNTVHIRNYYETFTWENFHILSEKQLFKVKIAVAFLWTFCDRQSHDSQETSAVE